MQDDAIALFKGIPLKSWQMKIILSVLNDLLVNVWVIVSEFRKTELSTLRRDIAGTHQRTEVNYPHTGNKSISSGTHCSVHQNFGMAVNFSGENKKRHKFLK